VRHRLILLFLCVFAAACPASSDDDDTVSDDDDAAVDDDDAAIDDDDVTPGDGSLETCDVTGALGLGYEGSLACSADTLFWDLFEIDVGAGACVHIRADNGFMSADLKALAQDANGDRYGHSDDLQELDDNVPCTLTPWTGDACPEGAVVAETTGAFTVGVSQWGGTGCPFGAAYTLYVAVDGVDVSLDGAQVADDVELSE